jgi:hypothetical protein
VVKVFLKGSKMISATKKTNRIVKAVAETTSNSGLGLKPLEYSRVTITIKGVSPLVQHKWSEKALRQMREKHAGKKTKDRDVRDPKAEAKAPAPKADPTKGMTAAERRKYTLKVDGQEIEEELSDDDIRVRLQKAHAVDKRFQEVAQQRKAIEEALKTIKTDPAKALKEIAGLDLDEWAEKRIMQRYEEAMLPEADREKMELQKKLAEYERQFEEQRTSAEQAKMQAYEQQVFEQTERDFVTALDQLGYDKPFARQVLVPMMAEIAESALDYGVELTPAQMASEANKRLEAIHRRQVGSLKGDSLLKFLGDDVVNEAIRAKLAQTRGASAAPTPTPPPAARKPETATTRNKPMTPHEWRMKHLYGVD